MYPSNKLLKLKGLYSSLDRLKDSGEDVVADIRKEINNLELQYLKEDVFPELLNLLASRVSALRCSVDMSLQFDGESTLDYSFCKSGSSLFVRDKYDCIENGNTTETEVIAEYTESTYTTATTSAVQEPATPMVARHRTIRIEEYSEKSIAVYGDTRPFAEAFKERGGYFNVRLRGGVGWIFSKKREAEIRELLKEYIAAPAPTNNQPNLFTDCNSHQDCGNYEDDWIERILTMKCMLHKGHTAPHKAVFMLTLIEAVKKKYLQDNRIFPKDILSDCFNRLWAQYVRPDWPFKSNFYQPFIHMSGESFYSLVNAKGVRSFDINQNWTRWNVMRNVEYATLDEKLFQLLHDDSFTNRLREALINKFLAIPHSITTKGRTKESSAGRLSGFISFLRNRKSKIGKPYTENTINVYTSALKGRYMRNMVASYVADGCIESVGDIATLEEILSSVSSDYWNSVTNSATAVAVKLYIDYRKSAMLSSNDASTTAISTAHLPVAAPSSRAISIQSIEADDILITQGNSTAKFIEFIKQVGVDLVYEMKIPFREGYLIDYNIDSEHLNFYRSVGNGLWLHVNSATKEKIKLINIIGANLGIHVKIVTTDESGTSSTYNASSLISENVDSRVREDIKRTKYSLNGASPLNKRRAVWATIRKYMLENPQATWSDVTRDFPAHIQGSYGIVSSLDKIQSRILMGKDDVRRYFIDPEDTFKTSDGVEFAVCDQWGLNFISFQHHIESRFGWTLQETDEV